MKINIVNGDMWQAAYINEKLVYENHHLDLQVLFNAMKKEDSKEAIGNIEFNEEFCDIDWLEDEGNFPDNYGDIQF